MGLLSADPKPTILSVSSSDQSVKHGLGQAMATLKYENFLNAPAMYVLD